MQHRPGSADLMHWCWREHSVEPTSCCTPRFPSLEPKLAHGAAQVLACQYRSLRASCCKVSVLIPAQEVHYLWTQISWQKLYVLHINENLSSLADHAQAVAEQHATAV